MFVYYKGYISIEFIFLKELMLLKQINQKIVTFVTFLNKGFKFQPDFCK